MGAFRNFGSPVFHLVGCHAEGFLFVVKTLSNTSSAQFLTICSWNLLGNENSGWPGKHLGDGKGQFAISV